MKKIKEYEQFKILAGGDSTTLHTGYANQIRGIFKRLCKYPEFDVSVMGWQSSISLPTWVDHQSTTKNIFYNKKHPGTYRILGRGLHQFGMDVLPKYIKQINPDLLYILCDTFMIPEIVDMNIAPAKFVMYFPSDGDPFPKLRNVDATRILKKADVPVAMSKYALEQYGKYIGDGRCKYIPHGTDVDVYFPFNEKQKLLNRKVWSNRFNVDLTDKFVLGAVGRFQGRKAHPELLKIFSKFSKDKDDVFMVVHADPFDPAGQLIDIYELLKRYNIQNKILFTGNVLQGINEHQLCEFYNLMDIHLLATTGEGFGIPTIEAMSCSIPSVLTDYTTTEELLIDSNCGWDIPLSTNITGTYCVERAFVDKNLFVDKLNEIYYDRDDIKEKADNCRKNVLKNYSWEVVFPKWKRLFEEILNA